MTEAEFELNDGPHRHSKKRFFSCFTEIKIDKERNKNSTLRTLLSFNMDKTRYSVNTEKGPCNWTRMPKFGFVKGTAFMISLHKKTTSVIHIAITGRRNLLEKNVKIW